MNPGRDDLEERHQEGETRSPVAGARARYSPRGRPRQDLENPAHLVRRTSKAHPEGPSRDLPRYEEALAGVPGPEEVEEAPVVSDAPKRDQVRRRVRRRARVFFWTSHSEGVGNLIDLSLAGAKVETPASRIETGGKIRLSFNVGPAASRIEICGEVARLTGRGFAVRFIDLDPEVEAVLRKVLGMDDSDYLL